MFHNKLGDKGIEVFFKMQRERESAFGSAKTLDWEVSCSQLSITRVITSKDVEDKLEGLSSNKKSWVRG